MIYASTLDTVTRNTRKSRLKELTSIRDALVKRLINDASVKEHNHLNEVSISISDASVYMSDKVYSHPPVEMYLYRKKVPRNKAIHIDFLTPMVPGELRIKLDTWHSNMREVYISIREDLVIPENVDLLFLFCKTLILGESNKIEFNTRRIPNVKFTINNKFVKYV